MITDTCKCGAKRPGKLDDFFYAIMKEARRSSLMDVMEYHDVSEADLEEIRAYLAEKMAVDI